MVLFFNVDSRIHEYVILTNQKLLILAVETSRKPFFNFDFIDLERIFPNFSEFQSNTLNVSEI